jgi:hypothetical protein
MTIFSDKSSQANSEYVNSQQRQSIEINNVKRDTCHAKINQIWRLPLMKQTESLKWLLKNH